jgi:hypothetical protein
MSDALLSPTGPPSPLQAMFPHNPFLQQQLVAQFGATAAAVAHSAAAAQHSANMGHHHPVSPLGMMHMHSPGGLASITTNAGVPSSSPPLSPNDWQCTKCSDFNYQSRYAFFFLC